MSNDERDVWRDRLSVANEACRRVEVELETTRRDLAEARELLRRICAGEMSPAGDWLRRATAILKGGAS